MFLSDEKKRKSFEIYTPYSKLNSELKERREDDDLKARVLKFFGPHLLPYMEGVQKGVLSRNITSPNIEMHYFLDLVQGLTLEPLALEYHDRFVARNITKYHLCKLCFNKGQNKNGELIFETERIVNFNTNEGKLLSHIQTEWGEDLISFHHKLLFDTLPIKRNQVKNFTDWFNLTRDLKEEYYVYFLSLFVCHGVLFENFLIGDKEEEDFLKYKFFPSFNRVKELFGVAPLIHPLVPLKREEGPEWYHYQNHLHKKLERRRKQYPWYPKQVWSRVRSSFTLYAQKRVFGETK